jgi:hypothetical protein
MFQRSALASVMSRSLVVAAALILVLGARPLHAQFRVKSDAHNGTYPNQKLKTGEKAIRSVALLPPTVIRNGCSAMGLSPGEQEESVEARSRVSNIMETALRQRGWGVDAGSLSDETLKNDPRMRTLVDYLRTRAGNLAEQMLNRPADTKDGRYSLGAEVAGLDQAGRADALVVVRSAQLTPRCDSRVLYMDILLVDSQSGEILGFSTLARHHLTKFSTEKKVEEILGELKKIQ